MKKFLVALILAVILTATLATPVFAGGPPDAAEKGLNRAITEEGGNEHTWGSLLQGIIAPWWHGALPNGHGYAIGPVWAYRVIQNLLAIN